MTADFKRSPNQCVLELNESLWQKLETDCSCIHYVKKINKKKHNIKMSSYPSGPRKAAGQSKKKKKKTSGTLMSEFVYAFYGSNFTVSDVWI